MIDRRRSHDKAIQERALGAREVGTMFSRVLFVSVARSFDPSYTLSELEPWVERAWATSVSKAAACDRVVAVFEGNPIAAWRVRGAYASNETYLLSNGDERPRVGLSLGEPLPLLKQYFEVPSLRRGVADVEVEVEPLVPER